MWGCITASPAGEPCPCHTYRHPPSSICVALPNSIHFSSEHTSQEHHVASRADPSLAGTLEPPSAKRTRSLPLSPQHRQQSSLLRSPQHRIPRDKTNGRHLQRARPSQSCREADASSRGGAEVAPRRPRLKHREKQPGTPLNAQGPRGIFVWESTHLVNWRDEWLVAVENSTAGMARAPEAIWDPG